jgi:hypothetical protein
MKKVKTNLGSFAVVKLQTKSRRLLAIIAFVTVIGFSFAACKNDSGGGDTTLTGTWFYLDSPTDGFKFNNDGSFEFIDEDPVIKGTYNAKDGKLTITATHYHGDGLGYPAGLFSSKWYTKSDISEIKTILVTAYNNGQLSNYGYASAAEIEKDVDSWFSPITYTYSISGKTLTLTFEGESGTLIKQ